MTYSQFRGSRNISIPCLFRGDDHFRLEIRRAGDSFCAAIVRDYKPTCGAGPDLDRGDFDERLNLLTASGLRKAAPYTPWCEEIMEYVFDREMMG